MNLGMLYESMREGNTICPSNMWADAIITQSAEIHRKVSDLPISVHSELNNKLGSIKNVKPNLAG